MINKATQTINQATEQFEKNPLKEIQKQFEDWRNTRQKREPIPEALWEAAVTVAQYNPIGRVSRILRINHRELKKKINFLIIIFKVLYGTTD